MLELPCAWSLTTGNPNHTVGIIDGSLCINLHTDLQGKIDSVYKTSSFTVGGYCKGPVDPPQPGNNIYHGLGISGIIAAVANNSIGICGAAYNTKLNIYDYTSGSDNYISEITSALTFAVHNGEKIVNISLSLCAGHNYSVEDFVAFYNWVVEQGTTVVYSAGNTRQDVLDETSKKHALIIHIPGIITVSSVNEDNETFIESNGNYHVCNHVVKICAPGYGITTTSYDPSIGEETYKTDVSGTSCSAAFVSSAIALMLAVDNTLTPAQIEEILLTTTDSISDFEAANNFTVSNFGENYTAGRLNTYHAVYKALHYNECETEVINSGQQVSWNTPTYICGTLTINGQLTISAPVHFLSNNAEIIINDGGVLIIDNGGEIVLWEDEIYNRNIIVNPGGKLIIKNGGNLTLSGYGKIDIMFNETGAGELIYNQGANIQLLSNKTFINIAGVLTIAPNAQFTFTGNGYIKFSNPGIDNTYNISAGTGASILFSGNGKSDKVLEIQQNTVHFPQLSSLTFQNCKIEMGAGKRMQADHSYPVTFNNVKLTSTTGAHNNHRSFLFNGQSYVTINNSIFEYGYYGIYGNLTWTDGAALFITNSTFRYNTQGINIYGKGLNLTNCNVVNNTNYGIYCNGMSFTSDFTDCTISNNGNGIYYFGSNGAHINMEDTYIQSNNVDGLITSGAFDVNMLCVDINANRYGIRTSNGTFIKPYTCDFSNNYNTIFLNYGYVSLYKKYNQLQAMNDNYTLYGRTPVIRPIRAEHNRWESNQNATPVYLDNYYLRTYQGNKPPMPVEVWDSNPLSIACHFLPPILIRTSSEHILEETTNNNLPTVTISEQTMPLDEAVSYLQQQSKNINSETAFLTIIEEYSNLISSCNTWTDSNNYSEIKLNMSIAYGDLHSIISDFYTFVNHDKANQSFINGIEKIILLNENLVTNSNLSYTDYYEYSLDIPLLYRIIGNYDDAISYLENLLYDFSDEQNKSEMEHIQTWLCKINAEKAATEGLLNIDEFFIAIEDCENCYSTKKSQQNIIGHNDEEVEVYDDSFNNKELSIENSFEIIPNPNQGNFKIKLLTSSNNCEIRIINSVGQTVKRLTSIKERLNEINITGLKTGYYKVVYIQDNEIIDTQTVIVK